MAKSPGSPKGGSAPATAGAGLRAAGEVAEKGTAGGAAPEVDAAQARAIQASAAAQEQARLAVDAAQEDASRAMADAEAAVARAAGGGAAPA